MLKKLIKHELLKDVKLLSIYYIITIAVAIISRALSFFEGSFVLEIIGKIFNGATISMIFTVIINNVLRLWVHFKANFYGDESYLTHTLPVKRSTLYFSKIWSAIITLTGSSAVCAAALAIAHYSKENLQTIKLLLDPMAKMYDSSVIFMVVMVLLLVYVELLNTIQCGYVGIILGHRCNGGKVGMSVLIGCGVYCAESILLLLVTFLMSLVSPELKNLFITNGAIEPQTLKTLFYIVTAEYFVLNFILVLVSTKLLKKGVNVD